jgi:hypothetical protein
MACFPHSSNLAPTPINPLPHEPKTLREFVEADLRRAARLILKVQDEIDPQFRFSTPEDDDHLAVTLPPTTTNAARC